MFTKNTEPARHSVVIYSITYFAILVNGKKPDLPFLARLPTFVRQRHTDKVDDMKPPQQLSSEAIEEFKAIYQEEFGELLSDDEVQEIAMRLLRFFGILNGDK
jgi:hypothetical protein